MHLHVFEFTDITIPKERQRKLFDPEAIQELAASIADNGLIHPLVVRRGDDNEIVLVAGERRLRALEYVWEYGQEVRCGTKVIPEGQVPCLFLGEIDPVDAFEIELEENIRRRDLDWKEKALATSQLYELRRLQAERAGKPAPTMAKIAEEISGSGEGQYQENIRQDIILARNLDNPVVAKATSRKEAFKALKRDEETKKNAELGAALGPVFNSSMHTLLQGDCLDRMKELPDASFDVILTDPPYGIDAQDFGDSDGKTAGGHFYDDSPETFKKLIVSMLVEVERLAKAQAHMYLFCDIEHFLWLREQVQSMEGWKPFRTPFIFINPTAMRAPWPEMGPQRKWQMVLYAVKGNKPVTRLYADVLTYPSDTNLGHQAQKPVALYADLLRRSVRPGDSVLDPFCGTGTIFPASHELKVRATGIELNPAAYGIAAKRLGELK